MNRSELHGNTDRTQTKTLSGSRTFTNVGASYWNQLIPIELTEEVKN